MSDKTMLAMAYFMGFDDALAKRKPDSEKTAVLASDIDLESENAKLRELLVQAYKWIAGSKCGECPVFDKCRTTRSCIFLDYLKECMHELGIEVTE